MTADGIDVALGSGPGLAFIVKGSPVKGIAAMAGPPLLFALMVRADNSIKSVDDLKGRNVGVSTVGSVTSWIVSEVSRQKGWGFGGIAQVPIGDDATRIAALRTKSVDAAIVNLAAALKFVQRRRGPHPASLQRPDQGLPRPRHLRHRQDHRGEARDAARLS